MIQILKAKQHLLWDMAGVDGLQVMKSLLGEQVDRIAPFQSLEAKIDQTSCSVLRLCENNFRIRCQSDLQSKLNAAATGKQVWLKQFPWLGSLIVEAADPAALAEIAVPKPPFHLHTLALHCALPARIAGISVLIWRHPLQNADCQTKDGLELHTAQQNLQEIESRLRAAFTQKIIS